MHVRMNSSEFSKINKVRDKKIVKHDFLKNTINCFSSGGLGKYNVEGCWKGTKVFTSGHKLKSLS